MGRWCVLSQGSTGEDRRSALVLTAISGLFKRECTSRRWEEATSGALWVNPL
jgi:hypothetical protein